MSEQHQLELGDRPLWRAAMVKRHLAKMDAMHTATQRLFTRPLVGRDVFLRHLPCDKGELTVERKRVWRVSWHDLLHAYGQVQKRQPDLSGLIIE